MQRTRFAAVLAAVLVLCFTAAALGQDVPRIGKDELKARLGSPDMVLLDVRVGGDWKDSELKIPGAVRPDLDKKPEQWAAGLPRNKEIILYCA